MNNSEEFPRFSFCLIHFRLVAEEVSNLGRPTGADKKKIPIRRLFSIIKGPGKGQHSKTEYL